VIPVPEFRDRDVAVFGLARSGVAAARALMAGGARVFAWDDGEAARARATAAGVTVEDINRRDWRSFAALVLSPGVPLRFPRPHRIVELAEGVGTRIMGDTELFARTVNALDPRDRPRVIGVTGTNGKSTTTALIGHVLGAANRDVRVGGNIGVAVLDLPAIQPGAHYVLELSSFQLDLTASLKCDAAVLLNITPDHLDRHGSMANYADAKRRIFRNQLDADWSIVGVDDEHCQTICTQLIAPSNRIVAPVSAGQMLGRGVFALDGRLYDALEGQGVFVADLAKAKALRGRHNWQNAAAAYAAARALGVPAREIEQALYSFPGLAHRMENVRRIGRVLFVNDSKATNADASAQALAAFDRVHWILGGQAKAGGVESLEPFFPKIAKAYLIGESAGDFARTLEGKVATARCGDLETALAMAARDAAQAPGQEEIVLLSPAAASFDQFTDFEHRGDVFKALVAALPEVEAAGS
jgi:UDP-N-acetylmuramoylalanine--D-glutamate ligase